MPLRVAPGTHLPDSWQALTLPPTPTAEPRKCVPSVVVGVVGMGHVPGIEKNWTTDLNIQEIMT